MGLFVEPWPMMPPQRIYICKPGMKYSYNQISLLFQFGSNLSWLPPAFPRNVRCIVSCNEGAKYTYSQLQSWCIYSLPLLPLPTEVRKEICTTYLGLYNKVMHWNHTCSKSALSHVVWIILYLKSQFMVKSFSRNCCLDWWYI